MKIDDSEDFEKPVKIISFKGKRKTFIVDLEVEEQSYNDQDTDDLEEE